MSPVRRLPERSKEVNAVRLPTPEGITPDSLFPERSKEANAVRLPSSAGMLPEKAGPAERARLSPVTRPLKTVTPDQEVMLTVVPVPHSLRGCSAERVLLAACWAQLFWMATKAWQSSARSLLMPGCRGLATRSAKVPSVQLSAESMTMASLAGVPEYWQPTGS